MQENTKMQLTRSDEYDFKHSNKCHICSEPFEDKGKYCKVRDHDHRTGKYRGAAH